MSSASDIGGEKAQEGAVASVAHLARLTKEDDVVSLDPLDVAGDDCRSDTLPPSTASAFNRYMLFCCLAVGFGGLNWGCVLLR